VAGIGRYVRVYIRVGSGQAKDSNGGWCHECCVYPYNWAKYLKLANERRGNEAEVLYAPHQWPIWGKETVLRFRWKRTFPFLDMVVNEEPVQVCWSAA
jgi:hypothetical protein